MPILSTNERFSKDKDKEENVPDESDSIKPVTAIRKRRFRCTFAGKGITVVSLLLNLQKTITIKVVEQIYEIPSDKKGDELKELVDALLVNGFVDTSIDVAVSKPKSHRSVDHNIPQSGMTSYKLGHPDNEPDYKIEGVFAMAIPKGKEVENVQVDIEKGYITTDRLDVAKALVKEGFNLISQIPIAEKKKESFHTDFS